MSHNCLVGLPGPVLAALTALTALDASVNLLATLPDCLAAAAPPPPPLPEAGHSAPVCPGGGAGLTRLQVLDLHYNSVSGVRVVQLDCCRCQSRTAAVRACGLNCVRIPIQLNRGPEGGWR